jgi:angiomotin
VRNRLSLILAALALLVPVFALTSVAAQAAPAAYTAAAPKDCPDGSTQQDYYCAPTETPVATPTEEPVTPEPTPTLPQTGAKAGTLAGIGGGALAVGAVIALWAVASRRRHRFEA